MRFLILSLALTCISGGPQIAFGPPKPSTTSTTPTTTKAPVNTRLGLLAGQLGLTPWPEDPLVAPADLPEPARPSPAARARARRQGGHPSSAAVSQHRNSAGTFLARTLLGWD